MGAILASLRVDPGVLGEGVTETAMTDAAGALADGYEPLFTEAAQAA